MAIWDVFRKNRVGQLNSSPVRRERSRRGLEVHCTAREEEILRSRILSPYPEHEGVKRLLTNVDAILNPIFDALELGLKVKGTFMKGFIESEGHREEANLKSEYQRRVNKAVNRDAELRGEIVKLELICNQLESCIRDKSLLLQAQPATVALRGGTNEGGGESHV